MHACIHARLDRCVSLALPTVGCSSLDHAGLSLETAIAAAEPVLRQIVTTVIIVIIGSTIVNYFKIISVSYPRQSFLLSSRGFRDFGGRTVNVGSDCQSLKTSSCNETSPTQVLGLVVEPMVQKVMPLEFGRLLESVALSNRLFASSASSAGSPIDLRSSSPSFAESSPNSRAG